MKRVCYVLLFFIVFNAKAQLLFYQNTFRGGVTCDGVSYWDWTFMNGDTIIFQTNIPNGASIKKATIISLRTIESTSVVPDSPIQIKYNGENISIDSSNIETVVYGIQTHPQIKFWIISKDVTNLTIQNNNTLIIPCQNCGNDRWCFYNSFLLCIEYEKVSLPNVNVAIYLNNKTIENQMIDSIKNLNAININHDVGMSIFTNNVASFPSNWGLTYVINSSLGNFPLGTLDQYAIIDGNNVWKKTLPGSFYYENNTLNGLVDDKNTPFIDSTNALCNIKTYLVNNTTSFNLTSNCVLSGGVPDERNAYILAYSTPCPARGGADSIKSYPPICSGATVQLQGVSVGNYTWSAANNSLNNDTVINPIANPTVTTNYIALVDSAGCKHTEQHRVSVYSTPTTDSVQTTLGVCGGSPATATIIAPIGSPNSYTVNGSVQHSPIFNLAPGTYTFALSNAFGCRYSSPKSFTVKDTNLAQAAFYPSPSTGCAPLIISCQNMSNNKANVTNNWVWYTNGDSSISQNFHYTFLDTGVYKITLLAYQNLRTCSATTSQTISVGYCPPDSFSLTAPNIFSPNGDGINDTWQPIIHNYQYSLNSYQCTLYDRWGNKVFANNSPTPGWSGKAQSGEAAPAGTYFYIINYKATGNSQGTVQENSLKGFIELIR